MLRFAVASNDYDTLSMSLVFDACETRACTDVRIINDNWPENAETFTVSLERNSAQDAWLSIDPAEAKVTILLNDGKEMPHQSLIFYFLALSLEQ